MVRFTGEEKFSVPRSRAAEKLSDAAFLAGCVPDAEIVSADTATATWRAKSRFRFVTAKIETVLTIEKRSEDAVTFALTNRMPGATLEVSGTFAFLDAADGSLVSWSAEMVLRTGLLKVIPPSVLRSQIEAELADLWKGVREKL